MLTTSYKVVKYKSLIQTPLHQWLMKSMNIKQQYHLHVEIKISYC